MDVRLACARSLSAAVRVVAVEYLGKLIGECIGFGGGSVAYPEGSVVARSSLGFPPLIGAWCPDRSLAVRGEVVSRGVTP